jgi:Membrane bound O-acyl transferase family
MRRSTPGADQGVWGWPPLLVLPLTVIGYGRMMLPWAFMWALSFAIYFSLKWLTWWQAKSRTEHSAWRSCAYLLAWPGMNADSFLNSGELATPPALSTWFRAVGKTVAGVLLLWVVAHRIPELHPLVRGWVGMAGLILLLHFGTFEITALFWQSFGIAAEPIMRSPLRSTSLREFWGKRWNLGFRQLAHELIFRPTYRAIGAGVSGFFVFLLSGLIHDLVISLPARGGYGLPTFYFVLQGIGVTIERSRLGKWLGLAQGARGWFFMMVILAAPVFWFFHPRFVLRVILPFMRAIRAL